MSNQECPFCGNVPKYKGLSIQVASKVQPDIIKNYAKIHGWVEVHNPLNANLSIFNAPVDGRYEQVLICTDIGYDDYAERVIDAIHNISVYNGVSPNFLLFFLVEYGKMKP